jgi:hypothetical protein
MEHSESLLTSGEKTLCRLFIFLGAVALAVTFYKMPQRAWANLLIDNFYFLSLSLSATVFIAALYLARAGWAIGFRRISEAMTAYLPYGALIGLVSFFAGIKSLYFWASPPGSSDPIVMAKAIFLNWRALVAVSAIAMALWISLARKLVANSRLQDEERDIIRTGKNRRLAAAFLILFALSYSLVAIYWVMSIEPLWYSTIYPWYIFAGMFVHGIAMTTILLLWLKKKKFYLDIGPAHLHDLGKLLFAFSCFWVYLWISQYLIIWYENIPEEVTHYTLRSIGSWSFVFWPNLIINFLLPFLILLGVAGKKNPKPLLLAAAIVAIGHWIDLYLLVMPPLEKSGPIYGLPEFLIFGGFAALFVLIFERAFRSAKPYPVGDPLLKESLALHE